MQRGQGDCARLTLQNVLAVVDSHWNFDKASICDCIYTDKSLFPNSHDELFMTGGKKEFITEITKVYDPTY